MSTARRTSQLPRLKKQFPTFGDLPLNKSCPDTLRTLTDFACGKLVQNLLLFGDNGSGKTVLGELLPFWALSLQGHGHWPDLYDMSSAKLTDVSISATRPALGGGTCDWVLLDEFDKLQPISKQHPFLSVLETSVEKRFILTANDRYSVYRGIADRCEVLEILPPTADDVLPYAVRRLTAAGKPVPADLLDQLQTYEGSLRAMNRFLDRLCGP